mmetsp:Transcript_15185/g.47062  ORF Transcript_15185/g.47062 Transcript_15185/m.47062 type:complete len:201 (+) Transcript_15185:654-1256(+)
MGMWYPERSLGPSRRVSWVVACPDSTCSAAAIGREAVTSVVTAVRGGTVAAAGCARAAGPVAVAVRAGSLRGSEPSRFVAFPVAWSSSVGLACCSCILATVWETVLKSESESKIRRFASAGLGAAAVSELGGLVAVAAASSFRTAAGGAETVSTLDSLGRRVAARVSSSATKFAAADGWRDPADFEMAGESRSDSDANAL